MAHPWIKDALALQNVDMQIRELNTRLKMIPVEAQNVKNERAEFEQNAAKARNDLHAKEVRLKETEQWIASCEGNITRLLSASASIRKQDEYDATIKEINSTKEKKNDLETAALELMDQITEAQQTLKIALADAADRVKASEEHLSELDDLQARIREKITLLSAERAEKRKDVPENVLSMYERLLARGKGEPIAVVRNGNCSNCNVKVTQQMINDVLRGEVVNCYCSQILTLPELINE